MGLMTSEAIDGDPNLGVVGRIHLIDHRVTIHRVAQSVLDRQTRDLREVVFRQLYLAAENRDQVLRLQYGRLGVGTVAFKTEGVRCAGAEKMVVGSAMRLVADRAALPKGGLVVDGLLLLLGEIGMAAQANVHRVGLRQPGVLAGMRVVAIRAIPGCAWMLHFGGLDQLRLVAVAGHAQRLHVGLGQDNFAIFGRRVAELAVPVGEGWMHELRHQLGRGRLVRIMTAQAIGCAERLIMVRLLQGGVFRVMTVHAQRRGRFGEVELVLGRPVGAGFMCCVTGVAAQVEGSMAAAFFRNIRALRVAAETEIVFLLAGSRLQQLILVGGSVRIMASQAIPNGWPVDVSLDLRGILVAVAVEAKLVRSSRDQQYPRDLFVDPDLMTTQTAGGNGGMDSLPLGLVFVALEALGAVDFGIKWNRVNRTERRWQTDSQQAQSHHHAQDQPGKRGATTAGKSKVPALAHELGKAAHPNLLTVMVHGNRRPGGCCEILHHFHK